MPAQILPLIDDSTSNMQQQRMQMQQQQNEQMLQLREARLNNEESLTPLKQQLLQAQIDEHGQAMKESVQNMTMKAKSGLQDYQSKLLDQQLTTQQISNAKISGDNAKTAGKNAVTEGKINELNLGELADKVKFNQTHNVTQILGQAGIDDAAMKHISNVSAMTLSALAFDDPAARRAVLNPLLEHNQIDQKTYNDMIKAPAIDKKQGEFEHQLDRALYDGAGSDYTALKEQAKFLSLPVENQILLSASDPEAKPKALKAYAGISDLMQQMLDIRSKQQKAQQTAAALVGPPKEGSEQVSKSGKPMVFKNGSWIYKD